jgi:hypothetical protein
MVALPNASHDGACLGTRLADHLAPLRMPRGASAPVERPATPLCSLPTVQPEPRVSTRGRRVVVREPPLRTPMRNPYRLCPPRCTPPTSDHHPDAQRLPLIPTPMIQRSPSLRTPMHNAHLRSSPRCAPLTADPRADVQPQPPLPTPDHPRCVCARATNLCITSARCPPSCPAAHTRPAWPASPHARGPSRRCRARRTPA